MSEPMIGVFEQFFSMVDGVVGNEANYQAALAHCLASHFDRAVHREFVDKRTGRGGIDVVIYSSSKQGISHAFEIKGGAYGDRNALNDTFDSSGYCKDFDKLAKLEPSLCQCWMLAIDALELGRGLSPKAVQGAAEHARARKIGFAYYAIGEDSAEITFPDGRTKRISVIDNSNQSVSYKSIRPALIQNDLFGSLLDAPCDGYAKEADVVSALYSALLNKGCSTRQISLETYFGFAPGSRMQQRPDLCIYEPVINGRFNLYPHGDRNRSNDSSKLDNIRAFIEIKGSKTLASKSDNALMKIYAGDLEKVAQWKVAIDEAAKKHGVRIYCDYLFIAIDHRKKSLPVDAESLLQANARKHGVVAHYIHTNKS